MAENRSGLKVKGYKFEKQGLEEGVVGYGSNAGLGLCGETVDRVIGQP